jgi:mRNA interferase RelE/StbE
MASFDVVLKPAVEKDLRSLSKSSLVRVMAALDSLANEPFSRQTVKLEGSEDLYRLRVGDYRIIYEVDRRAKHLIVHYVRHRREVYRKL